MNFSQTFFVVLDQRVCARVLVGAGWVQVRRHPRRRAVPQRLLLRTQGMQQNKFCC